MIKMLKNFIKNTIMILLLLFVTISFSGFNSMNSWVAQDKQGYVYEYIRVALDRHAIEAEGSTVIKVASKLDTIASQFIDSIKYGYDSPGDIAKATSTFNEDVYTCGVVFKNVDVYNAYYANTDCGANDFTEKHFLYSKIVSTRYTMFAKHKDFYSALIDNIPGETKVTFSYQTQFRRAHSDADSVIKQDGIFVHSWDVNLDNLDEPIIIYYNVVNSGICILLCVAISIGVCLIILCVDCLKNLIRKFAKNK